MNVTRCWLAMAEDVRKWAFPREGGDPASPRRGRTAEAQFCSQYRLGAPLDNVVAAVAVDRRWAVANTLHFFAATERAAPLRKYNKHADKFITGDKWRGAYGATAVPQLKLCVELLRQHPETRRAVVSMGGLPQELTQNLPCCWNFLHFQARNGALDLGVYQRSLSLRVMPYDAVVLSNALLHVAVGAKLLVGKLVWTVGNLHDVGGSYEAGREELSVVLPYDVSSDPELCYRLLEEGEHTWTGL